MSQIKEANFQNGLFAYRNHSGNLVSWTLPLETLFNWSGMGPGHWHSKKNISPLQYSCLENPMDQRAWGVYDPCGYNLATTPQQP